MASPTNVFITGASTGIGRSLALEYARRGARVALCARRRELLEQVAAEMDPASRPVVVPADVADPASIREAVLRAERALGSLDVVIANAGLGKPVHAARMSFEQMTQVVDINVRGAFATLLAAVPIMILQKHGLLVGVSSLAGRRGLPQVGAYSASKAALSTFLETLRMDLAPCGIHVTDVRPGYVATPLTETNQFPMPWLWTADEAGRVIVDRLARRPRVIAFPWPLVALTAVSRLLPAWLYERLASLGPSPDSSA